MYTYFTSGLELQNNNFRKPALKIFVTFHSVIRFWKSTPTRKPIQPLIK